MKKMIYSWLKQKTIDFTAVKTRKNGEMLIVCSNELEIYFLNSVARFVVEHMSANTTIEDIKNEMLKIYDVDETTLENDLVDIIRDLQWKRLITLR